MMPLFLETWILLMICFVVGLMLGRFIWKRD